MRHLKDLEDGKTIPGDSGSLLAPPEDFDMAKFHRGRQFFRKHIYTCTVGMFISLVTGMAVPAFLEALVFTNKSDTPRRAFYRYTYTFRHVVMWFYGDVWQKDSPAQQSICEVRKMHQKVRERMQTKHENGDDLFLSQYDMGIVQSGFMGGIILHSEFLGIKCTIGELDDYVYSWYGIGHLLGIQTKYNICAHGLSQAQLYAREIEQDILCKALRKLHPDYEKMSNAVVKGVQQHSNFFLLLSRPVMLAVSSEAMTGTYEKLSFGDTIKFFLWKLLMFFSRHFSWFRAFVCNIFERRLGLVFTKA